MGWPWYYSVAIGFPIGAAISYLLRPVLRRRLEAKLQAQHASVLAQAAQASPLYARQQLQQLSTHRQMMGVFGGIAGAGATVGLGAFFSAHRMEVEKEKPEGDCGEMEKAHIWFDEGTGTLRLRTPYIAEFVEALKSDIRIPYKDRRWNKELKLWEIEPEHLDATLDIMGEFFDVVESAVGSTEGDAKTLLDALSPDSLRRLWHELCLEHHPDKGGDEERMKELTLAFKKYKGGGKE